MRVILFLSVTLLILSIYVIFCPDDKEDDK